MCIRDRVIATDLFNDKASLLIAVEQDGWALKSASLELRADKEVVLAAVKQRGGVLYYASDNLKLDKEVVLAAIKQNMLAWSFVNDLSLIHI